MKKSIIAFLVSAVSLAAYAVWIDHKGATANHFEVGALIFVFSSAMAYVFREHRYRGLYDDSKAYDISLQPCCYTGASPLQRSCWMILCRECGNKRCPKATNCIFKCTGSNDPGQPGSRYQ
jgi:hypothetical protein